MLHPSYTDLMKVVNKDVEEGETKVVNSRYSIVLATSKRARQLIDGQMPLVNAKASTKPLSTAISELNGGKFQILAEGASEEQEGETSEEVEIKEAEKMGIEEMEIEEMEIEETEVGEEA